MVEVRRITEPEAGAVADLWDRMCRETPDGGPLTPTGYRNIQRMLEMAVWHHQRFCLVAVDDASVIGFVVGRVDPGDGLLPCLVGEIGELYVVPSAAAAGPARRRLAEAAVAELRQQDVWTIRCLISADAQDDHGLWREVGFTADLVGMSLYREP